MAVAMIWGSPGAGKTVAATAPKKEKIKLLCSDNSSVVLSMFERKNVEIGRVEHWLDPGDGQNYFSKQFENALNSGKYTLIICDNLTDIKEMDLLEIDAEGVITPYITALEDIFPDSVNVDFILPEEAIGEDLYYYYAAVVVQCLKYL